VTLVGENVVTVRANVVTVRDNSKYRFSGTGATAAEQEKTDNQDSHFH